VYVSCEQCAMFCLCRLYYPLPSHSVLFSRFSYFIYRLSSIIMIQSPCLTYIDK